MTKPDLVGTAGTCRPQPGQPRGHQDLVPLPQLADHGELGPHPAEQLARQRRRARAGRGRPDARGQPSVSRAGWQSLFTDRAIDRLAEEVCVAGVAGSLLDEVQQHPPEREVPPVTQRLDR
jgi:hypothetical protein